MRLTNWQNVVICSYHTPGPYQQESERLEASINEFPGLNKHIICRGDLVGDWKQAVLAKPRILKFFLKSNPGRPILMVDADAVVMRDPRRILPNTWVKQYPPPFSIHKFANGDPCSGTIICSNTPQSLAIVKKWILISEKHAAKLRQPQRILMQVRGINMDLAAEWCWIFDLSRKRFGDKPPIIEHLQASREFRKDKRVPKQLLEARLKRIRKC